MADILARLPITKIGQCNSTTCLGSHIIDQNCSPLNEYGTKIVFLPMQGWSDFAVLVTDRHIKLQFLERLQSSGLKHHQFSECLTCYCVVQKKYIAFFCHCTETRNFVDGWCIRRAVESKRLGGD